MSDDDNKIELNRRRVLGGIVTVGAAAAAAGAGTFAAFSDTESSDGNSISAGRLDLTTGGSGSTVVSVSNIKPGTGSTTETLALNNVGNIDGSLDIIVDSVVDNENDVKEPELESNDEGASSTGDSDTDGELAEKLDLTLNIGSNTLYDGKASGLTTGELTSSSSTNEENFSLAKSSSTTFEVQYALPSANNEVMSDSFEFALTFELNQNDSQ